MKIIITTIFVFCNIHINIFPVYSFQFYSRDPMASVQPIDLLYLFSKLKTNNFAAPYFPWGPRVCSMLTG